MLNIPITLNQIRYILAVAKEGSTAAAARRLSISQPSISLAISHAEEELGYPLFIRRSGLGMEPTSRGASTLTELRAAYQVLNDVFSSHEDPSEIRGELSFGFMKTLGPRYVPGLVRTFQEQYPAVRVDLHEGDLGSLKTWLEMGRIDVALVYDFALPSKLDVQVLKEIKPYGLVWPGHPLAERAEVSVDELLADPLILMNLPGSREFFLSLLQGMADHVRIAFETGSVEFLRSAVANRLGVGLLATDLPYNETYDGSFVVNLPLSGATPPHRIALASNPKFAETPASRAFKSICVDEIGC
jgi:DNA-binding transcriptional LysR family regulator